MSWRVKDGADGEMRKHGPDDRVAWGVPEGPHADHGKGASITINACPDRMIRMG